MLVRQTRKRIARHSAKEAHKLLIAVRTPVEKFMPTRALSTRGNSGHLGAVILSAMLAHLAGAQINCAAAGIEWPRIAIPLFSGRRQTPIRSRQLLDCGDGVGARYGFCQAGIVAFGGGGSANFPR